MKQLIAISIFFVNFITIQGLEVTDKEYQTIVLKGNYSTNITVTVNANKEYIIHFPDSSSRFPYTVFAWSDEADINYPVFIMVRQQKEATSWEIPLLVKSREGTLRFNSTSRTLCHNNINSLSTIPRNIITNSSAYKNMYNLGACKQLSMSVSTTSRNPTNVTIRVEEQEDFFVEENQNISFTISPSKPRYFYYKYPNRSIENFQDTVILEVDSQDDTCLTVSIQNATCPVFDLNEDIEYEGEFETVDTRGGLIINEKDFSKGFFVVFVAKGDDYDCIQKGFINSLHVIKPLNRTSAVSFKITPNISRAEYWVASLSTLLGIAAFYFIFIVASCGFCCWENRCLNLQQQSRAATPRMPKTPRNEETRRLIPDYESKTGDEQNQPSSSNMFVIPGQSAMDVEQNRPSRRLIPDYESKTDDEQNQPSSSNMFVIPGQSAMDVEQNRPSRRLIPDYESKTDDEQNQPSSSNMFVIPGQSAMDVEQNRPFRRLIPDYESKMDDEQYQPSSSNMMVISSRPAMNGDRPSNSNRQLTVNLLTPINYVEDVEAIQAEIDRKLRASELFLSDMATKKPKDFHRESCNYLWHVITVGVFYAVPVIQLAYARQMILNDTGNLDICYYNFLCAHPLWIWSDFNHIFSNVAYLFAGTLFCGYTIYRHSKHKKAVRRNLQMNLECGIPHHYGLYYAMSAALIMEGVLSACYHICPSKFNFQFDTSFMYVMAVLCIVKLYQNRHPDINATAYVTFIMLAVAIVIVLVGILENHIAFWIIFILFYIVLTLYLAVRVYFLHHPVCGLKLFNKARCNHGFLEALKPVKKDRFRLVGIAAVINIFVVCCGYCWYLAGLDFPTFLLILLMGNTCLYTAMYLSMKKIKKEGIPIQTVFYIIFSMCIWGGSFYFFCKNSSKWGVAAAKSRERNTHCIFMNFYDNHDVWHLLSAAALFFSFMLVSTLDDNLVNVPHDQIAVF